MPIDISTLSRWIVATRTWLWQDKFKDNPPSIMKIYNRNIKHLKRATAMSPADDNITPDLTTAASQSIGMRYASTS